MVFYHSCPKFKNTSFFKNGSWEEYYLDDKESIPSNGPESRGNSVITSCFVNADHAGCKVTRRSHTRFFIYVNRSLIVFSSKRQNTAESSIFVSEFIVMKQSVYQIEALRYKLRMMGFPMEDPQACYMIVLLY